MDKAEKDYWQAQGVCDAVSFSRQWEKDYGAMALADFMNCLDNAKEMCRLFDAQSPIGQMNRGERDYWKNKIKRLRSNENG